MYTPPAFRFADQPEQVAFMQRYSFATLVTVSGGQPVATHLPVVVSVQGGEVRLLSHLAKANPQWRDLANQVALVIFSAPHAYISPTHYDQERSVPTWNYVAVHAYGRAQVVTEEARTFEILEATIACFEAAYQPQWERLPAEYKTKMAAGIVAFELVVTDLQAQKKLSQNKTAAERARIQASLAGSPQPAEQDLAAYMGSLPSA
ncbi:FMN-binding negative transcriptional regulator [Hymenobacter sp. HMF4947]|uniref:FMN-binding negative transcriptional regulator n=1 Tax=Hymenobacter ginkgonis TaxID=2682976 RepID=A0A7K1TGF7_9BACT|nr:FMN-binding negative transcriptional regulator [Hymenobacter ginkgonis]MVN77495.1 FMN-binding negative transcriptional regulator [Hymenobacter ginkgonis]